MARILVVYYSRTGTAREVASQLARALDADLEEIADRAPRVGPIGFLRSGLQALRKTIVALGPSARDPAGYDLVVIGGPTWSTTLSSPVRSYLRRHKDRLPAVAFFRTCGGRSADRVFAQMTIECGRSPVATLSVVQAELAQASIAIQSFALQLEQASARNLQTRRP